MPIDGLGMRMPRLGMIKLGTKVPYESGGRTGERPAALDYFLCDDPAFQAVYPGEPRVLDIEFATDELEQFADQHYRSYTQTRSLVCKGDGINARRLADASSDTSAIATPQANDTEWIPVKCSGVDCDYYEQDSSLFP